jgi:hypothetical protein
MPSPIHESIISRLSKEINQSTPDDEQIRVFSGEKFKSFGGQWSSSSKVPDLAVEVCNADDVMDLKWVLEVGFSEQYEQLKDDVQLWLGGSSEVSMATIVGFCETPRYHCPLPIYSETGEELDPREVPGIPSDFQAIQKNDVIFEGDYGPTTYKGLTWAGQISEAWMETWVRDAHGKVRQRGNRVDLMHVNQVELEFGDFLPPGYPQAIAINLEKFRSTLQHSIRKMTVLRCQDAVDDYLKRHGESQVADPDYRP